MTGEDEFNVTMLTLTLVRSYRNDWPRGRAKRCLLQDTLIVCSPQPMITRIVYDFVVQSIRVIETLPIRGNEIRYVVGNLEAPCRKPIAI